MIAEPLRDDSDETMPGLTVRSTYYEQVPIDDSPTPSPKALPTYLRALRYSEEDLSAPDKSPFDRAKTLSIRSYDTDSPSECYTCNMQYIHLLLKWNLEL